MKSKNKKIKCESGDFVQTWLCYEFPCTGVTAWPTSFQVRGQGLYSVRNLFKQCSFGLNRLKLSKTKIKIKKNCQKLSKLSKCNFIPSWKLLKESFCMSEWVEQGTRAFPAIHLTRSKASLDLFTLLSQF